MAVFPKFSFTLCFAALYFVFLWHFTLYFCDKALLPLFYPFVISLA